MKNYIYKLFLLGIILSGSIMHAQTVKGVVSDKGGPIPQVNITVKGTTNYAITDFDGNYSISNVSTNAILVFSYIGYQTQEIPVNGNKVIDAFLTEDSQKLNEVIIVGYSSQKKGAINGAVTTVDMNELSKTRVADVAQALQGQVAGVVVSANTGAPGDGIKVRIRGEGTLGNNDALYVIDGVATRDISFLNQSDIKSMTVLKDASATAIYGSRAAGGVVIITTKNGIKGMTSFDVELFSGIHYATNLPKMLNSSQYLSVKDQAWHNTKGNAANAESPYAFDRRTRTDLADTNWQDQLFTTGLSKNLQISASGATENLQYLISGGYYGIDGIVVEDNDQYKRYNFRTNVNANITDRFKVGTNMQIGFTRQDKLSSSGDSPGIIRHALLRSPVISVYKDVNDPTYSANDPYTDLPFYTGPNDGWSKNYEYTSNPIAMVHFTNDVREQFRTFGNVYAEFAFLGDKSLKFKSSLGVDVIFSHNKSFGENYGDNNIADTSYQYYGMGRQNRPNSLNEDRGQDMTFTFTNTLNYTKTFHEAHNVSFLLGIESINNKQSAIGGSRNNYENSSPEFQYLDYGNSTLGLWNSGKASSWSLLSYFASGNYGYNNKYFATATIRADASSRFGPNNKWGYFPSIAAGWVISKEKFMSKVDWISNLKLRTSWGQSGNQEIKDHQWYNLYSLGTNPKLIRIGNPDVKWETTTQTNVGLDLGILKNKLAFTVDYFSKITDNILLDVVPPGTVGDFLPTSVNSASVSNKGFEFGLNFQNNDHEFKYGINANVATLKNNVDRLQQNVNNITDDATHTKTVVGQPISSYYGYQFDGIYQNASEVSSHLFTASNGTQPGDIKFKDLNNDGQINADDRTFIGSSIPKITYGFNFNADYKNFDLSFLLQGVGGVDRYNDSKQILNYDSRPFNSTTAVLNSWNGEGTSNTTPRLTFNDNGGSRVSSVFVEDASYLRLKNIEIGYTFSKSIPGLNSLRLYVSGQNLFTITSYTGLDPESTSLIDKGTYPQSSAFIFGAKVKL
ncbi:SusC/RagA family TonB-linked outer membrane protein [Flavobacterium pectinovorum]|uniref:TonB-dependent receptor n=1 Tax=Flavobacterium pectinovorum TaxID=29533 RepID=A0A502F1Y1_9FLAO|nr:TonB-dependent receptor [Flavobacterium pectinovorum]TPG44033.1 TonB-dependent receptor [Flavobacterium pectinovorum]